MSIPQPWTFTQRIAFRFFFVFFALYIFPFPISVVLPQMAYYVNVVWQGIVPWFAEYVLHLPYRITVMPNGSGDTTFNYVQLLLYVLLALIAAIVWSLLTKRKQHSALHHWLRVSLRFYLFMMMVIYGMAKVFHAQMPAPFLSQLIQPLGDKSPMGLAWTYVGLSAGFSAFTGWAEVIGGLLLVWRRTVTLGAMVCIAVMINVVAINYFFDVPVKLFSSTLLAMSIFLLAPDVPRLMNLLVWNQPVQKREEPHYLPKRWMRIVALVISLLFVAHTSVNNVVSDIDRGNNYSVQAMEAKTPLYGIYNADLIVRNKDTMPMLLTDTTQWKQLVIQNDKYALVKLMNDSMQTYGFKVDTALRTVTVSMVNDTSSKSILSYTTDSAFLVLRGIIQHDSVYFRYTKKDHRSYRLVSSGFRWINEYPVNR